MLHTSRRAGAESVVVVLATSVISDEQSIPVLQRNSRAKVGQPTTLPTFITYACTCMIFILQKFCAEQILDRGRDSS